MPGSTFENWRDVRLGIQRGSTVIDDVPGDVTEADFTAVLRVGRHPKTAAPNFLGPYAHGTPEQRFVYLSWSGIEAAERRMFRRAKLQLETIGWDMIDASVTSGQPIEVALDMTDRSGGPACATLKKQGVSWTLH